MSPHDFVRAFLACYFTFVALYYGAKLAGVARRTGHAYADAGPRGTPQHVAHTVFYVFRLVIWAVCVVRLVAPTTDPLFVPLPGFGNAWIECLGAVVMCAALFIAIYAQSYLDTDWRSGVPNAGPPAFLTDGPYAIVRHPALVGVLLGQVGFFLALPTVFSLICLVIGATVVLRQATYEEAAMRERFGQAWDAYVAQVPRWPLAFRKNRDHGSEPA